MLRAIKGDLEPQSWWPGTVVGSSPEESTKIPRRRSPEEQHLLREASTPSSAEPDFVRPTRTTSTTRKALSKRLQTNLLRQLRLPTVSAGLAQVENSLHAAAAAPARRFPPLPAFPPPQCPAASGAPSAPRPMLEPSAAARARRSPTATLSSWAAAPRAAPFLL